jgi:hypothetical protein
MISNETFIIEKAAHIIKNKGIEELTIYNLATELSVNVNQLYPQFAKDNDLILMIMTAFENELKEFGHEHIKNIEPPEIELKLRFKKLHFLFLQKPYYLSIILDQRLIEKNNDIKKSFFRIRNIAATYLAEIINKGKKENIFKTNESTKTLVRKILNGFRIYMQDEHILNRMVVDIVALRTIEE